jgi:hypothetical protein
MIPPLSPLKSAGLCVLAILALLCPGIASSADELDIAGLRLGMTPEQAREALLAFGAPADKIQESRSKFWFMDGDKRIETPDFIDRINGNNDVLKDGKWVTDQIALDFAPPPEGGRVVRITRTIENYVDAPTVADYRKALTDKYGPPDQHISGNPVWMRGPGKADCVTGAKGKGADAYVNAIYRRIQGRVSLEHLVNPRLIKGPDDCAIRMSYKLGSGDTRPAKRVTAELIDPGTWVKAQLAAMAALEKQQAKAVEARDAGASKPKL